MKNKLKLTILLLSFGLFMISGCRNDQQPPDFGPKWTEVKPCFIANLKCSFECDAKEKDAFKIYTSCMKECTQKYQDKLKTCQPGSDIGKCLGTAGTEYLSCISKCNEEYNTKMEEIFKCRQDCNNEAQKCLDGIK